MTSDNRVIILFPNRMTASTHLSGGLWLDAMPLDNLKDRQLSRIARSANVDPASTWFQIDLGRQRSIRGLAFLRHNFSFSARIRAMASNVSDLSTLVFDETFDAWAAVGGDWNIDELAWESDNYWLGSFSPEETGGQTSMSSLVLAAPAQARYWRFQIIDPDNLDGYVELGRLFIGDGFLQPEINYSYGAQFGYETATKVETSLGGSKYFDRRESLRVLRFDLSFLSKEEGFGLALELSRRAGSDAELFVIPDPSDRTYAQSRNFLGRLRQPGLLTQTAWQLHSMPFEIEELR